MENVLINPTAAADHLRNSGHKLSDTAVTAAIVDREEAIRESAQAQCLGVITYVKQSGRNNALKSVVLLRMINAIDKANKCPNFQFISDEADDEVNRIKSCSTFLKRCVFNSTDNLIHQPRHVSPNDDAFTATVNRIGGVGKLGIIWKGKPTWAKPVAGNEYLAIKVNGREMHYIDFIDQLAQQRPYFGKYLNAMLNILKLPIEQTIGMKEAELWMLL